MNNVNYQKRIYILHTAQWTPVKACLDCNDFWLKSSDNTAFLEDTTGTGAHSDTIPGNVIQYLPAWSVADSRNGTRFTTGDTITFLSATVDGQKVTVTYVR